MEKKIKSVKKNGVHYEYDAFRHQWVSSTGGITGFPEFVSEDTILNSPSFEIEFVGRWRAVPEGIYETLNSPDFNVTKQYDHYISSDDVRYESGNYFKPGKAQAFADFIKENISKFHDY